MAAPLPWRGVHAETLTPFAYHSLAVPSGTATIPELIGDRAIAFAVAAALGALRASPVLPSRDYAAHMRALPLLASVFESVGEPRLLRPLACRLNLDTEGGMPKRIMDATGTGNLKTYYFIQEVPPRTVFQGAVFGRDPFALASEAAGQPVEDLIVRIGLGRAGLVRLIPAAEVREVRLNVHTAKAIFGVDLPSAEGLPVQRYVLHDFQLTPPVPIERAAEIVARWRDFPTAFMA
jgi:hypothetical protein